MKTLPHITCAYVVLCCVWWLVQDYIVVSESMSNILFALIILIGIAAIFAAIFFFAIGSYKKGNINQLPFANGTRSVSIIFIALILIVVLMPTDGLPKYSGKLKFDSDLWRSEKALESDWTHVTPRQKMIKDLIRNNLSNKTKEDIFQLLGPSDTTKYSPRAEAAYLLGLQRGFGVDNEWLLVYFTDNKVKKTEIYVD